MSDAMSDGSMLVVAEETMDEPGESETDMTVVDDEEKEQEVDETNLILLRTKMASVKTELLRKDVVITDKNNEIDALTKDLEETNESLEKLRQEIYNKDKLNETIIAQNESLKIEIGRGKS